MGFPYVITGLKNTFAVKGVYTIHYFKYGKNFKIPGESHNFWELVYIDAGKATITSDKNQIELKQGEAIMHSPNEFHNISTQDEFARSAILSFECSSRAMNIFKNKIFTLDNYEKDLLGRIIKEGSILFENKLDDIYLKKLTRRKECPFGSEQVLKNDIELLLISLVRNSLLDNTGGKLPGDNISSLRYDAIVDKIKGILVNNVYGEINLDKLAEQLYFSKTYIKTVFRKNTGTSIIQYYLDLKIEEAKKLISQNKLTFTEISFQLCLNSVHYFSRLFKKRVGITPSEYAKSIKVDNLI